MNINRRDALKSLAFTTAAAWSAKVFAQNGTVTETPIVAPEGAAAAPFIVPPLPYSVDALEPHVDAQTMTLHHDKHHQAYVDNLNKAVTEFPELAAQSVEDLVRNLDSVPESVRTAVRNHGGGHANHSLFWKCLSPDGGGQPEGPLADAISNMFANFDAMKAQLITASKGVFGSGWAWLCLASDHKLLVTTTPNQDSPLTAGHTPLLGIDVWEHAYYLKYQNRRAEYAEALFNVMDWQFVGARYVEEMDKA